MNAVSQQLTQRGFDLSRLGFSVRTAVAACLALLIAWTLGLEHPQWSAMTVWAASQPERGMLIEKSLFRAHGTLVGTLFGVLLMTLADGSIPILVVGLALWVGACAAAGNLVRGLIAYGTLLSGYSASMVVLLSTGTQESILTLGADRLLTVMVGVTAALLVGLMFAPRRRLADSTGRLRQLTNQLLRLLQQKQVADSSVQTLLEEIAVQEDWLESNSAGSIRSRRHLSAVRHLLNAQVSLLLWLSRNAERNPLPAGVPEALDQLSSCMASDCSPAELLNCIEALKQRCPNAPEVFLDLLQALPPALIPDAREMPQAESPIATFSPVVLHRDWVGARQAMLRASGLILLLGTVWWLTDWSAGPYLLLGASIMISLFSTLDNPAAFMRFLFIGQLCGALVAMVCAWLIWPLGEGGAFYVLSMLPFVLLGILPMLHPRSQPSAMDFNMIMLLLLQPTQASHQDLQHWVSMALAVVSTPLVALVAYRYVFPTNLRQRSRMLIRMMLHELQDLADTPTALKRQGVWRARLNHRVRHLLRLYLRNQAQTRSATWGCLAVLETGECIFHLHQLAQDPTLGTREQAMIRQALRRLTRLEEQPGQAALSLQRCADLLQRHHHPVPPPITHAVQLLNRQQPWFNTARVR